MGMTNFGKTYLLSACTDTATSLSVSNPTVLGTAPYRISVREEIMEVTAVNSNILTVIRGREGTVAVAHPANAIVAQVITRDTIGAIPVLADADAVVGTIYYSTTTNAVKYKKTDGTLLTLS